MPLPTHYPPMRACASAGVTMAMSPSRTRSRRSWSPETIRSAPGGDSVCDHLIVVGGGDDDGRDGGRGYQIGDVDVVGYHLPG
ncbi:MAG TPA: hypothetical protein VMU81_00070 [Acetobacteraceae bacterium]|nr:hypothetical protein [Acetobacteraceae bacterium]